MKRARLSLRALLAVGVITGCNAPPGAPAEEERAQPEEVQDERVGGFDTSGGSCVPPGSGGGPCNQNLDGGTRDGGTSADGGARR
jgi:hypothetical protein